MKGVKGVKVGLNVQLDVAPALLNALHIIRIGKAGNGAVSEGESGRDDSPSTTAPGRVVRRHAAWR